MMLGAPILLLVVSLALGDDDKSASPQPGEAALKEKLLVVSQADAEEYVIELVKPEPKKLTLQREPVLLWTNPTRQGGQFGAVYVWTLQGRPQVVGTIFTNPRTDGQRGVIHELHSLANVPLVAVRGEGKPKWEPATAGVELRPVAGASPPAATASARLLQMRSLAREFVAESVDQRGRWELRVLPRPLYRYPPNMASAIDGALFAFVTSAGTDPEVILLLEAATGANGQQWYYGIARFSDLTLSVSHQGRQVWSFTRTERAEASQDRTTEPYRLFRDRLIDVGDAKAP